MKSYILTLFFLLIALKSQDVLGQDNPNTLPPGSSTEGVLSSVDMASTYDERYAVLIGINKYQDSNVRPLTYAAEDAVAMKRLLKDKFGYKEDNIFILLDENATRSNIISTLERFTNDSVSENSSLLIYYAGHGQTGGRKDQPLGFLLNHDVDTKSLFGTSVKMNELRDFSDQFIPKHVLFLIDACYSGLATTRSGSGGEFTRAYLKNVWSQKSREIITAGSADEEVVESADWQHSALMYVLLEGLEKGKADENKDNIVISKELFQYIMARVPYYAKMKGGKQTPIEGAFSPDNGSFFFELTPRRLEEMLVENPILMDVSSKQAFKSKITLKTNVDNARIFLDSKQLGYATSNTFEYRIDPGLYKFEVRKDRYNTEYKEVEIKPDEDLIVEINLSRETTLVRFKVVPENASITINNELISTGSTSKEFKKGRYVITVDASGYKPIQNTSIDLTQDEQSFEFVLEKISTLLQLYTIPDGAVVTLKDKVHGKTPLNIELGYGEQRILLTKPKHTPKLLVVDVKESKTMQETVRLEITPEEEARGRFRKDIIGHGTKFLLRGSFAAGLILYGRPFAEDQYNKEAAKLEKEQNANVKSAYNIAQYAVPSLGAIWGLSAIFEIGRIVKMDYNKYLEKVLSERVKVSIHLNPSIKGASIVASF
ncbi:MAG: caspase family protein [Rhodothermia bacterium]|nr:caspase family protein [Rhodothermia bacterium]